MISTNSLLFAHWFKRKREYGNNKVPHYIEKELDRLRPLKCPHASAFFLIDLEKELTNDNIKR